MATIRYRGRGYQVQIRVNGRTESQTFSTKKEAQVWAKQQEKLAANQISEFCFADVIRKYKAEITPTKGNPVNESIIWDAVLSDSWTQIPLHQLTSTHLSEYRNKRMAKVKPSTFKSQWALIKAAAHQAKGWGWNVPMHLFVGLRLNKVVLREINRISDSQYAQLQEASRTARNNYISHAMVIALETGMRRGEMLQLTWDMVDLERGWINLPGYLTKSNKSRSIPISPKCESALLEIQQLKDEGKLVNRRNEYVATDIWERRVLPVTPQSLRACWNRVRNQVGMKHLRWHDLRHEAISRLFEIGLTVPEVQSVSGHSTISQLERYSHPAKASVLDKVRGQQS